MNAPLNILLILTDEHRLTELAAYGETPCKTPNLDRLASQSTLFTNAYTSCPLCSPARASVITGLFPHSHGITANTGNTGCNVSELIDAPRLLPRKLEAAGYGCGYTGKWHLGTPRGNAFGSGIPAAVPSHFGFVGQDFPGHGGGGFGYPEYRAYLEEHGYTHELVDELEAPPLPAATLTGPTESTVPYFLAENTISLIDRFRSENKPFFIWHNFWGPHQPYYAPKAYLDLYEDVEIPQWPSYEWETAKEPGPHQLRLHPRNDTMGWAGWEKIIKRKYAFMTLIDEQIGRILDHLDATGLRDNTAIIFTADHGDNLGTHGGLIDKGFVHFDDTHRIPMLVALPGQSAERRDDLVSLNDVYYTVLELAGCSADAPCQGQSLLKKDNPRDAVVTEFNGLNSIPLCQRTIRSGSIKYGYTAGGRDELYDLDSDPDEMVNLIDHPDYQAKRIQLRRQLDQWMAETKDPLRWQYSRFLE